MKKELISEAVSNIKEEYITEAQTTPTANRPWQRRLVAAVVALCLLAGGLWALSPSGAMNVTAYAVDSNQPITANGVVLDTGTISDSGEMTHHPLQFCLDGAEMKSVRFSCKNQELVPSSGTSTARLRTSWWSTGRTRRSTPTSSSTGCRIRPSAP